MLHLRSAFLPVDSQEEPETRPDEEACNQQATLQNQYLNPNGALSFWIWNFGPLIPTITIHAGRIQDRAWSVSKSGS